MVMENREKLSFSSRTTPRGVLGRAPTEKKTLMELFDMSQNTSVKREASTLTAQVC